MGISTLDPGIDKFKVANDIHGTDNTVAKNAKVTQLSVAGPGEESKCSAKNIDPNIDTSTKVLMDIINENDKLLIEKEKELHKLLIYEKEFGKQLNTFSMDLKRVKKNTLNKEKE